MKIYISVLAFVALFMSSAQCKSEEAIKVSGFWSQDLDWNSSDAQDTLVFVVVQNVGQVPVTILAPVKNLLVLPNPDGSRNKMSAVALLHVALQHTVTGQVNIPSEVDVRPIRLLPGEAAQWRCNARIEGGVDPKRVSLSYEVEKAMADRFHAWSGSVEVPITEQPRGGPTPPISP